MDIEERCRKILDWQEQVTLARLYQEQWGVEIEKRERELQVAIDHFNADCHQILQDGRRL